MYSCYDRYVSHYDIATIAKELSGADVQIAGEQTSPKHQIISDKIKGLGMQFGGETLLKKTVGELLTAAQAR